MNLLPQNAIQILALSTIGVFVIIHYAAMMPVIWFSRGLSLSLTANRALVHSYLWIPIYATVFEPVSASWCSYVGLLCDTTDSELPKASSSHSPFQTPTFPATTEHEAVALEGSETVITSGCLQGMRDLESHIQSTAHLITLAPKALQFSHVLHGPRALSGWIEDLAQARREVIEGVNKLAGAGQAMISVITSDPHHTGFPPGAPGPFTTLGGPEDNDKSSLARYAERLFGSSVKDLPRSYMKAIDVIYNADLLGKMVSVSAHEEVGRLRQLYTKTRKTPGYFMWKLASLGQKDPELQEMLDASAFLNELLTVVDGGVGPLLKTSLMLQRCEINVMLFASHVESILTTGVKPEVAHANLDPNFERIHELSIPIANGQAQPSVDSTELRQSLL